MVASTVRVASAVVVIATGLVIGAWSVSFASSADGLSRAATSGATAVLAVAAGWGILTAGVIGTWRNPRLPGAPLLILAGIGWFVAEWSNPGAPTAIVFTIGLLIGAAWPAMVAHAGVLLGRTRINRAMAALLAAGYAICLGPLGFIPTIAYIPAAVGCTDCPDNLLGFVTSDKLVITSTRIGFVLQAAWVIALAIALSARLLDRRGFDRRLAAAVQLPVVVAIGATAADAVHSIPRGSLSNDQLDVALWVVSAIGLSALAIGAMLPIVRARTARRSVVRFGLEVASAPPLGEVERRLARILDDPALTIEYPIDARRSVEATGRERSFKLRGPALGRMVTSVTREGVEIARIDHRANLPDEGRRLEDTVAAARLWLENERLHALQLARMGDLRRSRADIVSAADAERRRIERDLHDGSQQRLVGLAFELSLAREAAIKGLDPTTEARFASAESLLREALADLRELAHGIYPRALIDQGLGAALEDLADAAEVPLTLTASTTRRFDHRVEATAYHVVAEAVRPGVFARAELQLRASDDRLSIDIHGRGPGLSAELRSDLEERILALDGTLQVGDDKQGHWIRVELPCVS
jgi:signal transduction histidine kinase